MNEQEIKKELNRLDMMIDIYSGIDMVKCNEMKERVRVLEMRLLDMMSEE